ncbi:hypothetical protein [Mediterraneibacter sp.]|uniref:hypothetical protein n=1 Tax=Mediterraneibacter sp. TaxID=2316022 RepID=UPI002061DDED|nr:hypothetical protein [Mediterraneibacter sp.]DAZ05159.1 MAG TPA: hypothetical protein [Caudoviricetes sp.]
MLTNTDITIFNAFSDKKSKKIVYVPHYIDAVWFHADQKTVDAGYKFTHQDVLYKTINPGQQFQAQWIPGQETESIFTRIDEEHTGTKADPIPYHVNMEVFEGKYYTEDGILYRCTRNSGQALQNKASELVGHYFEAVK